MIDRLRSIAIILALFGIGFGAIMPSLSSAQQVSAIDQLTERAKLEMITNPSGILKDAERVASEASRESDPEERIRVLATAEWLQAQAKMRLGDLIGAKQIANQGLARLGKTPPPSKLLGDLLMTLGNIAMVQGDVQAALPSFQRAHDAYRVAGHARGRAMALQGLGNLYHQAGDYKTALKYFEQSESVYEAEPSLSFIFHNNHGNALSGLERYSGAENQYTLALSSARKAGDSQYIGTVLNNTAVSQLGQNKLLKANETIKSALKLNLSPTDKVALLALKAKVALEMNDLESAGRLIDQAMAGVDPQKSEPVLRDAHYYAYEIYSRLGKFELAAKHLDTVWHMDEANVKLTTSASAALMAAKFDFDRQESQIDQLKAEQLALDAERQRTVLIFLGLFAIILLLSLIFIIRSRNAERAAKQVLEVTNLQLEKAMAAKMEFLATTSHEIRTPLNGILGMTQVILADKNLDVSVRERVQIVSSAGETMKALVDDILDVAKMENGNLSVQIGEVELRQLLTDAAQIWRVQAEEKGVAFNLNLSSCPDRIAGDGDRLRQVIFNLLSNAMKFTVEGSVGLQAQALETIDGQRLRISVSDSGIGIAPEWHDRVFDTFQQVDGSKARNFGGSGLGLAICRQLIEVMGGRIWVESVEDEGATFLIDLPLTEIVQQDVADSDQGSVEQSAVLIVEANPLTRGLYRAMLDGQYDVIAFAASLDEAILYLNKNRVDQVLLDEDCVAGESAKLTHLKEKTDAPLTLAGHAANDDRITGFSSQIGKPVNRDELLKSICK